MHHTTATVIAAVCLTLISSILSGLAGAAVPTVDQIYDAARSGHLDQAQHMIDQVLRDHPESSRAHFVQAELYAKANKPDLARSELARAETLEPGLPYERPRAVRELKAELGLPALETTPGPTKASTVNPSKEGPSISRVLLGRLGGTLVAPVVINNAIKLDFTIDSGAADVSIPADVFSTLVRTGTITRDDITGSRKYLNADGESYESRTFIIRLLKVGDVEVADIEAKVAPSNAPLLLGQSYLKRFKSWSIDNTAQELVLER